MTALALCLLALADASFSGFRAHAGRDGRIVKRRAKTMAALTGLVAGLVVLAVLAMLLLGEAPSSFQLLGAGTILAGLLLATVRRRGESPRNAVAEPEIG